MHGYRRWLIILSLSAVMWLCFIVYQLYSYYRFISIRDDRYTKAVHHLQAIRDAELLHKELFGTYQTDFDALRLFFNQNHFKSRNFVHQKNLSHLMIDGEKVNVNFKINRLNSYDNTNQNEVFALKVSIKKIDLLKGLPERFIAQEITELSPIRGDDIFFGSENEASLAGNWPAKYNLNQTSNYQR